MIQEKFVSAKELARELEAGVATTKFILKRFRARFPFETQGGERYYSRNILPLFIKIKEDLDSGMLPSEIDQEIEHPVPKDPLKARDGNSQEKACDSSSQTIELGREGLNRILSFLDEFKDLHRQIAASMETMADVLQEMNRHWARDRKNRAPAEGERPAGDLNGSEEQNSLSAFDNEQDLDEIVEMPDPCFDLLEASEIHLDDLSQLLENSKTEPDTPSPLPEDLDDLSLLIEPAAEEGFPAINPKLDDLSLLVDEITAPEPPGEPEALLPMDDLSALIDPAPSVKPDIPPAQDLAEHKAFVMKRILQFKTEGLTPEQTTRRLNDQGVQTLSGKPLWSEKAILKIYELMDSAR